MPKSHHPAPPQKTPAVRRPESPDFFIVGAPKCGTTAMADYLARHPELFMAQKEMHHFGSDLQFGSQFYRRNRRAYLEAFAGRTDQSRVGEASVWYLFSQQAALEIKEFNPKAQIIIMLREPAEMLYSLYHQFLSDGNEHLPTFREALEAQTERRAGRLTTRQTYFPQGLMYHEVGAYTEQVRRYIDVFGRDRVHVVLYDDFAAAPETACDGVFDFLGVDSAPAGMKFPVINGNKSVKSPALRAFMADPLVRGTAIALRSWLPRPVFSAMQGLESRLLQANSKPEKRPKLEPDLRASLKRYFRNEVEDLSELLDRDLTAWSREALPIPRLVPEPALAWRS